MIKAYVTDEQLTKVHDFRKNQSLKDDFYEKLSESNYKVKLDKNKSIDLRDLSDNDLYMFIAAMNDQFMVKNIEFLLDEPKIEYNFSKKNYEVSKFFGQKDKEKLDNYVNINDIDNYMQKAIDKARKKYDSYEHTVVIFDNSDNTVYHYFLTEEDEEERIYELF